MRGFPRMLLACVAALVPLAAADATSLPVGTLAPLTGPGWCVTETGTGGVCADGSGLDGATDLALAPDGASLYVTAAAADAVSAFARDAAAGTVTQLAGTAACVSETGSAGACADARALDAPHGLAVSPDGRHVYVASRGADSVVVLVRDPASGALTQAAGPAGCIGETGVAGGCADGRALDGPIDVAVSPDGAHVYVASHESDAVAVLVRDAATGALGQAADAAGCVSETGSGGCANGSGLNGPTGVVVSPDGRHVYASADVSGAVAALARDAATGALTPLAGTDACIAEAAAACGNGRALDGVTGLAIAPDGAALYATAGLATDAVAALSRDAASGRLAQAAGSEGCVSASGAPGCLAVAPLDDPRGVTVSPDGATVYVATEASDAVVALVRFAGAGLVRLTGAGGCVSETGSSGACTDGGGLEQPSATAVAPDGRFVYATASASDGVVALRRQEQNLPPTCAAAAAAIPYGKPTGVALSCLDANGDPLALSIVTGPGRGTLGPVDGARATVVYTPAKGFSGTDAFSFQASDGVLASAAATITLTVAADAVPPVVRILSTRATLHARLVRFRIVCSLDEVSCRGALALTLGRRVTTRGASGERGDLLGRRRFTLAGGASTTLGVTLSRKAARLVRRANGLAAVATVRASDAAGNRSTISRAVRLRPGARSRGPA